MKSFHSGLRSAISNDGQGPATIPIHRFEIRAEKTQLVAKLVAVVVVVVATLRAVGVGVSVVVVHQVPVDLQHTAVTLS